WALGFILKCREIDLKLITVCFANILDYKIKVLTTMLQRFKRENIAVAIGREKGNSNCLSHPSMCNAEVNSGYTQNAVQAIKDIIDSSAETIYVISIGPATNIGDFAVKYPQYKDKYKVIAMAGAYKKGYINQTSADAEFNVLMDIVSANNAYKDSDYTMIPLDVCRATIFDGSRYTRLLESSDNTVQQILTAYREWQECYVGGAIKYDIETSSSILYDIVPIVYLLKPQLFTVIKSKIIATSEGKTVESAEGSLINVAVDVNINDMLDFVVNRLCIKELRC
ncbi:MAG: nucleoside hydrolase, partial [Clostridia bacterium]